MLDAARDDEQFPQVKLHIAIAQVDGEVATHENVNMSQVHRDGLIQVHPRRDRVGLPPCSGPEPGCRVAVVVSLTA
jgi:hypothetical protein